MEWLKVKEQGLFYSYVLPLFFFPLSTAGAGISSGLLILTYGISGYWRNWRSVFNRPWAVPLLLLIAWTAFGLLWTTNFFYGTKVVEATGYGFFALFGATMPWKEQWIKILIRFFILGLVMNAILAFLMTWHVLPWHNVNNLPYTGFGGHIYISLAIVHVFLWMVWDLKFQWNFKRWLNIVIAIILFVQLVLAQGRSGQLLFIILLPAAVWLLYKGRWRYWFSLVILLCVSGMIFVPSVYGMFALGVHQLIHFNIHAADTNSSWGLRIIAMMGGIMMFFSHPIFGVGTGSFLSSITALQDAHMLPKTPLFIMNTAANSFISEAAVLGIIGLGLFLWFLWGVIKEAWGDRMMPQNWFALSYFSIFIVGGMYNSLNWGYADSITIALMAGLPLNRFFIPVCDTRKNV
ncbi:O-antigen ligase family protein [Acidithiobacillus montserratensis]|uniref:O-antigen ligase family protein n=1 Tax=Acidithiobacillus montserratensis TaxID=2729135 RepID=A0ACD5HFT7_9PROT|nr:O-antigen ligase family protein [Acidithiobacillus montserratensis]